MSKSILVKYQSQPWIMEPMALKGFAERLAEIPESAGLLGIQIEQKQEKLTVIEGIARISIAGYLLDKVPDWMRLWGISATSYEEIAAKIERAVERKDVTGIELLVDSPGGMVAGVIGAAEAIYQARAIKPVNAVIKNLSASGAYWLTSQAETITASDINALAGSIGVYTYYIDWTKLEERIGIKVIVVRSGQYKGMGLDGITEEQIAAVQEYIDATADNFIEAVARGRGTAMDKIEELATGQLWIAKTARELGLVDAVIENTNQFESDIKGESLMENEEKTKEQVSTEQIEKEAEESARKAERDRMAALKEEFADDPEFAMQAFTDGLGIGQAKAAYCDILKERLKAKRETGDEGRLTGSEGAAAIATEDTDQGSEGDFLTAAKELAEEKKIPVTAAMKKLARQNPSLREKFLERCKSEGKQMYAEAI